MTYEPKVGDEVVLRGKIIDPGKLWSGVLVEGASEGCYREFLNAAILPSPDAAESELRGQVSGPWAVELAEAMGKVENRLDALEASAKVRDVPATMVNLAHRVQMLEGENKTLLADSREREDRRARELDGVLVRLGRLESATPKRPDMRGQYAEWEHADEVRDAQGRVLKSKTRDVDPQGDWSTARAADTIALSIDRQAMDQIRATNATLMADLQWAEERLDRIGSFMRGRERSVVKEEILKILQDPAHGDPPLSDPPANGDRARPLGDAE